MNREPMDEKEVKERLARIKKYNEHFATATDEKGNSLAHQQVGERQLWRIMTKEWNIDPTKFGFTEPPELPEWNGAKKEEPKAQPEPDISDVI